MPIAKLSPLGVTACSTLSAQAGLQAIMVRLLKVKVEVNGQHRVWKPSASASTMLGAEQSSLSLIFISMTFPVFVEYNVL